MKISVAEFDLCAQNVASWVRNKLNPSSGGPRLGYNGVIRMAIYRYHKTNNADSARDHLQRLLDRFRNDAMKSSATTDLESYLRWCELEQPAVAGYKKRLNFPLGNNIILGGEVGRLDVDFRIGGYRAVLLGEPPSNWDDGYRMPLIQRAVALMTQRDESEISVGFQELDGSNLTVIQYSSTDLNRIEQKARSVAKRLEAEWIAQGGTF